MKKVVITIIITGMICISAWALYSNRFVPIDDVAGSFLKDRTDTMTEQPVIQDIFSLLNLENTWGSKMIRVQTISNYTYNRIHTVYMPGSNMLFSSPFDRAKEIEAFKQRIFQTVDSINSEPVGLPKSSIYVPIAKEANTIASTHAKHMFVAVYTNCEENTDRFSIYRKDDRELLKKHPEQVIKMFKQMVPLGNLKGLNLYIIYHPNTDTDNEYFSLLSGVFKRIYEEAGAKVIIGANMVVDNS